MRLTTGGRLLCGLAVLMTGTTAWAQNSKWAEDMFEKREHDFGVVARGSDARYRLVIVNKYQPDVHISNVRTSCGCTAAKPSKDTLTSLEKAYIELTMDTKKFTAQKDSSVTITFDKPYYAEVRIPVKAFIRTDVVLTPGGAEFGAVAVGTDWERKLSVAYAGRESWKIKEVISKNPNIAGRVVETSRGGGRVNYDLVVTVKGSTPPGEFRDNLILVTDDSGNPNIPVLVGGRFETEYSVSPDLVDFGTLEPGAKKTMNVIVRGKKPFVIEKIESEKTAGTFEVRLPVDAKPIHVLPLTFNAPTDEGPLTEEFTITIGGSTQTVLFKAHGKVVAPAATGATATAETGAATAQTSP